MRYWDSSAIVPLLIEESFSGQVKVLLREDSEMIIWWGTPVECVSALCRKEREGVLKPQGLVESFNRLQVLQETWSEIEAHPQLRQLAQRLLRVHALQAADSLQLAAALVASDRDPSRMELVCYDQQLRTIAAKEGFVVLPEKMER